VPPLQATFRGHGRWCEHTHGRRIIRVRRRPRDTAVANLLAGSRCGPDHSPLRSLPHSAARKLRRTSAHSPEHRGQRQ
jgi:hypothetical protein